MPYLFREEYTGDYYTGDSTSLQAQNREFWVQLLGYDGVKWYTWIEMQPTYDGTLIPLIGGRFGTFTTYPAYCAQQNVVVPILIDTPGDPDGTYVKLKRAYFDNDPLQALQWVWIFWWPGPVQCLDVMTDWDCVNGASVITKKRICGVFTVSDP